MFSFDAILPAGGRSPELTRAVGAAHEIKALLQAGDKTLLECAINAAREAGAQRVVVVGSDQLKPFCTHADALLPEGSSGVDNVFKALDWLGPAPAGETNHRVLILSTDLPFVSGEALKTFCNTCPPEADICVPLVERQTYDKTFPNSPGTWNTLQRNGAQGEWSTGSAFLISTEALRRNRNLMESAFQARKNPFAMVKLLGFPFILKFLRRQLSIEDILGRAEQVLDCKGAAFEAPPELAFDIDTPEEWHYAQQFHKGKS